MERFQQKGIGDTAESWIRKGPNKAVSTTDLDETLGDDDLSVLMEKTGLSREELLSRLAKILPEAVDKYTPDGRLP